MMPLIETDKIIEEYFEKVKDQYPPMTLEQFTKICKAPFWFFNKSMARDDLPTINIKYLGKFIVLPSRITKLMLDNDANLRFKRITEEQHQTKRDELLSRLKEIKLDEKQDIEIIEEED